MKFTIENQSFSSIRLITLFEGQNSISNWYLCSKTKTGSENLIKYGIKFNPTQKYISSLQSNFWSAEMKLTYNIDYDLVKNISEYCIPTNITLESEYNKIGYFSIIELDLKEYIILDIPNGVDKINLYDKLLSLSEEFENPDIIVEFEDFEINSSKLLFIVYSPNSLDSKVNISTLIYKQQLDPLRNKKNNFVRNDYWESIKTEDKSDYFYKNDLTIEPLNHVILGTQSIDLDKLPILKSKLDRVKDENGVYLKWLPNIVYLKDDKVKVYNQTWISLCDGNIGLLPEISNFWKLDENNETEDIIKYKIFYKGEKGNIGGDTVYFTNTNTQSIWLKRLSGNIELTVIPKIGYLLNNLYINDTIILRNQLSYIQSSQNIISFSLSQLLQFKELNEFDLYLDYKEADSIKYNFSLSGINEDDIIPVIYLSNDDISSINEINYDNLIELLKLSNGIYTIKKNILDPNKKILFGIVNNLKLLKSTTPIKVIQSNEYLGWVSFINEKTFDELNIINNNINLDLLLFESSRCSLTIISSSNIEVDIDEININSDETRVIRYYSSNHLIPNINNPGKNCIIVRNSLFDENSIRSFSVSNCFPGENIIILI